MQSIRVQKNAPLLPAELWRTLPLCICDAVQSVGVGEIEELRLYRDRIATVRAGGRTVSLGITLRGEELQEILFRMCRGSLYAHAESIRQGYVTLEGGIRVGISGRAAVEDGRIIGIRDPDGLTVRIPHAVRFDAAPLPEHLFSNGQVASLLIYAPPGVGKTTLLREIARHAARPPHKRQTVLVDTREELRMGLDEPELCLCTLTGYPREIGIEIAVRSLSAELIVCDEIGSDADAHAILHAANCGVPILASAHAASVEELLRRPAIRSLHNARVFSTYVALSRHGAVPALQPISWEAAEARVEGDTSCR